MPGKEVFLKIRNILLIISLLIIVIAIGLLTGIVVDKGHTQTATPAKEFTHKVLLINSYTPLYYSHTSQKKGLEKSLYEHGIEYEVIYMDAKHYASDKDIEDFYSFLKIRLENRNDYEAILIGDDVALEFALRYQEELFKDLPIIFFGINDRIFAERGVQTPNMTGFYEKEYFSPTVQLALKLFPNNKNLVLLHDDSKPGWSDYLLFRDICKNTPDYNSIEIDTSKLSHEELVYELENLPPDSILFYMAAYIDKYGNVESVKARTNTLLSHTKIPIFRPYEGAAEDGLLGGMYMSFEAHCQMAGEVLYQVLSGEDIDKIPLSLDTPGLSMFNWNQIKQWKLDPSLFPKDTIFYDKPISFYEKYKHIIPVSLLLILAVSLMIISSYMENKEAIAVNNELLESIKELNESQELLRYQAKYDDILDIWNRRSIINFIQKEVLPEDKFSIIIIDVDGFKSLNENYGHKNADNILIYLVAIIKNLASNEDKNHNWKLARYGGDEFLLFIPDITLSKNHDIVRKLVNGIHSPIPQGSESLAITASIGISNSDGISSPNQHILNAESAMYAAKDTGRNRVVLFGDEMQDKVRVDNVIKEKVEKALNNDGFYMLYQPKVNSKTLEVCGFEALIRMKNAGLFPGQFIPIAEKSGWIWRIGRITTELTIMQLAAWRDAGYELHPVSVNYSSTQLNDHGYVDFVLGLLDKYNIAPQYFELEITEGTFIEKSALAGEVFKRFTDAGIKILMDDFGTGYSSLGYLTYVPVDIIKIDKSLVDNYLIDGKDSVIKNIICLMHDLGKEMIVEGVEEDWQFKKLQEFGADAIQGYYFSRPLSADDAINFTAK